ncbi:MAG TPA: hypothetical protein VFY56_04665 [Propionibacteriaceae bacterium]|nr:hypothetical protein [Propionibacteriaceae bacterium]
MEWLTSTDGAGRPAITADLLRHALTLLDKTTDREKYAQVREQLAAVDDALVEDAGPQP